MSQTARTSEIASGRPERRALLTGERVIIGVEGAPGERGRSRGWSTEFIASVVSPIALLALWEILVRVHLLDVRFFPAPSAILGTFYDLAASGRLFEHVGISLVRIIMGFLLGAIPGLLIGLTMGLFPIIRAFITPFVSATYPVPKLAILPLILLVFGLGETSKYVVIGIGTFYPVLINTTAGVVGIDRIYLDVGRNFGASRKDFYITIAFPGALPTIFAGIRIAWGVALLLILAAEFVGAQQGIGYMVWNAWQIFAIEQMYVGLIVISALGYLSFLLLDQLERWVIPWKARD